MAISMKTRKNLWGNSGNRCAICKELLIQSIDEDSSYNIGEECHIVSSKNKGPRYIENYGNYDCFDNLLLLCRNHHREIDELTEKYTKELLQEIKRTH